MRVNFRYKNGRERMVLPAQAVLLEKLKQGYMTRDMTAQSVGDVVASGVDVSLDLDAMDRDQLHTLAKARGVQVHHNAGADKVRAALREAQ